MIPHLFLRHATTVPAITTTSRTKMAAAPAVTPTVDTGKPSVGESSCLAVSILGSGSFFTSFSSSPFAVITGKLDSHSWRSARRLVLSLVVSAYNPPLIYQVLILTSQSPICNVVTGYWTAASKFDSSAEISGKVFHDVFCIPSLVYNY